MVSDYDVIRLITKIYAFVVEISTAVVCNYKNSECRDKQAVSEYRATSDSGQLLLSMLVVIRTLVAADMIFDRPPSDACVSAMHASGDQ